jgi:hypothetical protein
MCGARTIRHVLKLGITNPLKDIHKTEKFNKLSLFGKHIKRCAWKLLIPKNVAL